MSVSLCFSPRTICFEFDCHFVSSCMNEGDLFLQWGGFTGGYHNVCRFFVVCGSVCVPSAQLTTPRIEWCYYRFQTDGEIRILFYALVNVEVI